MAVFILQRDNDCILTRGLEWSWDTIPQTAFTTPHRDVALNQLLELTLKDTQLRAHIVSCPLNERGLPTLPVVTRPQLPLIEGDDSTDEPADSSVAS